MALLKLRGTNYNYNNIIKINTNFKSPIKNQKQILKNTILSLFENNIYRRNNYNIHLKFTQFEFSPIQKIYYGDLNVYYIKPDGNTIYKFGFMLYQTNE